MTTNQASYVTLDVFTSERFKGNPLALVTLNEDSNVTQTRKQQIAREFNFSETVFLHQGHDEQSQPKNPRVDIFTPVNEMEFAGHPIIGTGHFLFQRLLAAASGSDQSQDTPLTLTIETKAGPVSLEHYPATQITAAEVPHNVHIHDNEAPISTLASTQVALNSLSNLKEGTLTYPVISIVKGVTFVLSNLTDHPEIFSQIGPGPSPIVKLDDAWAPSFVGTMYYRLLQSRVEEDMKVWDLRVRMVAINLEDPACGSGSCSLGVYLALRKGQASRKHRFNINQGSEMGRESRIIVDVVLDDSGEKVVTVKLAGSATVVMEGRISV